MDEINIFGPQESEEYEETDKIDITLSQELCSDLGYATQNEYYCDMYYKVLNDLDLCVDADEKLALLKLSNSYRYKIKTYLPRGSYEYEETDERDCTFSEYFCSNLAQDEDYKDMYRNVLTDLELYDDDDDEKLAFLKSKLINAKKKLNASVYNDLFPLEIIKEKLKERLADYFALDPMSNGRKIFYCEDIEVGDHEYDEDTRRLFVHLDPVDLAFPPVCQGFRFDSLHYFESLVEHIQLGKFFLKLKELEINIKKKQIVEQENELLGNRYSNDKQKEIIPKSKPTLRVKQIALIHVYKDSAITNENAKNIASKYGYNSKLSGKGLEDDYAFFRNTTNRKARTNPFTLKRMQNKIELFESILEYLSDSEKIKANNEINKLNDIMKNELF